MKRSVRTTTRAAVRLALAVLVVGGLLTGLGGAPSPWLPPATVP